MPHTKSLPVLPSFPWERLAWVCDLEDKMFFSFTDVASQEGSGLRLFRKTNFSFEGFWRSYLTGAPWDIFFYCRHFKWWNIFAVGKGKEKWSKMMWQIASENWISLCFDNITVYTTFIKVKNDLIIPYHQYFLSAFNSHAYLYPNQELSLGSVKFFVVD